MIDVRLVIGLVPGQDPKWQVTLSSSVGWSQAYIDPLTDADLAFKGRPAGFRWKDVISRLRPGCLDLRDLRAIGKLIRARLFAAPELHTHLLALEVNKQQSNLPLRFLLTIFARGDAVLADLPVELLHDEQDFVFLDVNRLLLRCHSNAMAVNLRLGRGSRALLVTAHADGKPSPSKEELEQHAQILERALRAGGYECQVLNSATRQHLEDALLSRPVDILYVACHGQGDPDANGSLLLRPDHDSDKILLSGIDLVQLLTNAKEKHEKPVQVVLLSACLSAVPDDDPGAGMAQGLAWRKVALASLGFRGPVQVHWALKFFQKLFENLGTGCRLEAAFSRARCATEVRDPQWVLPLLYVPPPECVEPSETSPRETQAPPCATGVQSIRPQRTPQKSFTGRAGQRDKLMSWLQEEAAPQIFVLEGDQDIGKTELALWLAYKALDEGRTVLWLESPERDSRRALATMIATAQPGFALRPEHTVTDLVGFMRAHLASHRGLLVLDNATEPHAVLELEPSKTWHILCTTRVRDFMPNCVRIRLEPLPQSDALELFCRIAFELPHPPAGKKEVIEQIVSRIGGIPMNVVLSAAGMQVDYRHSQKYLSLLDPNEQSQHKRTIPFLDGSLDGLLPAEARIFCSLAMFSSAGATAHDLAVATKETEIQVAIILDQLLRAHLVEVTARSGLYWLHPQLREHARALARGKEGWWDELHAGVADAMEKLGASIVARRGTDVDLNRSRWSQVRERFDGLDIGDWRQGASGGASVAMALVHANQYRKEEQLLQERDELLSLAIELLPPRGELFKRASVLEARGELRRFQGRLDEARADLDHALMLFKTVQAGVDQANVLKARGDLHRFQGQLKEAGEDYDAALRLFQVEDSLLGQANLLKARGDLRRRQNDLPSAMADFEAALQLYRKVGSRQGQANVLLVRGDLWRFRAQLQKAHDDYAEALTLYRAVKDRLGEASVLRARGELRRFQGQPEQARDDYCEALRLFKDVENWQGQANVLKASADLRIRQDDQAGALRDYESAITLFRKAEDKLGEASARLARGGLFERRQDLNGASEDYKAALEMFQEMKSPQGMANVLLARGGLQRRAGHFLEARADYDAALTLFQNQHDRLGQANVLLGLGELEVARSDWSAAEGRCSLAIRLFEESEDLGGQSRTWAMLAKIAAEHHQTELAKTRAHNALELAKRCQNRYLEREANQILERLSTLRRS